ncbi:MAG TPA: autotransporter outer membrane beta-barrel domain-containing protein [Negativicutes bacterium]|nr:autotransporter outer membrane beta-barrel domain-containing protein [Negativicutes bacterium]
MLRKLRRRLKEQELKKIRLLAAALGAAAFLGLFIFPAGSANASFGTIHIVGNLTISAGTTVAVGVNAAGQSDLIEVGGSATLNGGTVVMQAVPGVYANGTTYVILTAAGGVTGTFSSVTGNLTFLAPQLVYSANDVNIVLVRNALSFADVAATHNEKAVAEALDRISAAGNMTTVVNSVTGLTAAGARDAFNQMGGLVHTAVPAAAFGVSDRQLATLTSRLGGAAKDDEDPSGGFWSRVYGNRGSRSGNDISAKYKYGTNGVMLGYDKKVSERLLIGIAGGYASNRLDMKDLAEHARANYGQGALYGSYTADPWYIIGIFAYGHGSYSTARNIDLTAVTASGSYSGKLTTGYLEAGRRIKAKECEVTPLVSFQTSHLSRGGFTETGAGDLNLIASGAGYTSNLGTLGVRISKDSVSEGGTKIGRELRVGWAHEFSGNGYGMAASFAGSPGYSFTVRGDRLPPNSLLVGLAWSAATRKNAGYFVNVGGRFAGHDRECSAALTYRYTW